MGDGPCELLVDGRCDRLRHVSDAEDLFSILRTWEECTNGVPGGASAAESASAFRQTCTGGPVAAVGRPSTTGSSRRRSSVADEDKVGGAPMQKKQKGAAPPALQALDDDDGVAKMLHIAVERNRRKQMNEHFAVLRSLMPCFYVKRGDQASIIGGVVDYIKELQQVLRLLEAKKDRKAYADQVLSPRPGAGASPRPLVKSTPPISPRLAVPISPRTPSRPGSPYNLPSCGAGGRLPHPAAAAYMIATSPAVTPTPTSSSWCSSCNHSWHDYRQQNYPPQPQYLPTLDSIVTELVAHASASRPALVPDVKVEFAGPNLVLKTVSHRAPGQALKIIAALESLSLEILHVSVSTVDETMVHSFTIKIGIECELSAQELVQEIQRTFS